ncbi:MAG: peptidoglycan bridge formation glycyltransferase FemA/FemB family protein, partial [Candidatus Helarchaeota archaeon]|nr:peptidoglycan bridge formation glycyltransferase FemA/FemB family protein [Candidatus Helarchaeota archaeon]
VQALRNEYVSGRRLFLRVLPKIIKGDTDKFTSTLINEGFKWRSKVIVDRTLLVDLSPSIENLRKGLNRKWRNHLSCAEKNDLEILEGNSTELYDMFISIYREMHKRKKFVTHTGIYEHRLIQKDLPDDFKMKIMVCKSNGKLCSSCICSAMGDTGYLVLGATSNFGRTINASYAVNWKILEWLRKGNYRWLDLCGINPIKNPGVYSFKVGFTGRNGKDVQYLGQFDAVENLISFLFVKCIVLMRLSYRKTKEKLSEILYSNIKDIRNFRSISKLL